MKELIAEFFAGGISESDLDRLEAWVNEDPAHEQILREQLRMLWAVALSNTVPAKKRRRNRGLWAVAAAAMLAGVVVLLHKPEKPMPAEILPETTYATLSTGNGQTIELDEQTDVNVGGGAVSVGEQSYTAEQMHLRVPRGGQYEIKLSDGTRVWLNSDSELTFPSDFTDTVRRVSLRGEAFFDVTKDPNKRFIVDLSQGGIAVYGTQFYVSDYADRPLAAVLVEGSIRLCTGDGHAVMMTPSHCAEIDRATGEITQRTIDTKQYTSWMRDRFVFYDQTLGQIAQTLERWYDVQIKFADPALKNLPLSGQLSRHADIRVLLDAYRDIEGINYTIEGNTITITNN